MSTQSHMGFGICHKKKINKMISWARCNCMLEFDTWSSPNIDVKMYEMAN